MPGAGFDNLIGLATEVTNGTAVAVPSGGHNRVRAVRYGMRSSRTTGNRNMGKRTPTCKRAYNLHSEGGVDFDLSYQGWEHWYRHLFGLSSVVTTTAGAPNVGAFTNVYTLKTARQPGGSLNHLSGITNGLLVYPGWKPTGWRWDFRKENPVTLSIDGIGQVTNTPAALPGSPTVLEEVDSGIMCINHNETTDGFKFYIGTAGGTSYVETGITEGFVAATDPKTNNRGNLGARKMAEPLPNDLTDITGEITREYIDAALITDFLAGTDKAFKFEWVFPTVIIPAGSLKWSMIIELPYVSYDQAGAEADDAGPMDEVIPFVGNAPTAATMMILTTINKKNAQADTQ
jgi:hypothetical protein